MICDKNECMPLFYQNKTAIMLHIIYLSTPPNLKIAYPFTEYSYLCTD